MSSAQQAARQPSHDETEKVSPEHSIKGDDKSDVGSVQEKQPPLQTADAESHVTPQEARPTANHASSVPNGGLQAWLQVLGAWLLFFNTWGMLNTFGIFQTYYESGDLFVASSSNISWIGAIQAFMVLCVGSVTGPIYDMGYFRVLLIIGTFMVSFGFMMLSLCHTYWQALLAQGFCVGIGAGCLFVPGVAILPTYFSSKIGLAIGLAASGSSMGGIIYPIVFYRLINQIGFGWTVRVLGFMTLVTLLVPVAVMKMRVKPLAKRKIIDTTAFTDFYYLFFVLTTLIGFTGLYVGLFYISYYAEAYPITSPELAFYLVPVLNAGSVFGRTIPNYFADKFGPLNIMCFGAVVMGILTFCLIAATSVGGIVVVVLLYGFFSGVYIALPPVVFVHLTKDKSKIGTRIGMGFAVLGLGVFCGGPGGGGVLGNNQAHLNWTGLWVFGGVFAIVSGLMLVLLRMMKAEWKLKVKV